MKLPNLDQLIIEREKVSDYLLNPAHRYGASKARFFGEFGFQRETGRYWPTRCVNTPEPVKLRR
jgi:hypothetical protein